MYDRTGLPGPAADARPGGGPGRAADKDDPDPEALACYGLPRPDTGQVDQMMLRFVGGRPVSHVATRFPAGVCRDSAAGGKEALLPVWDNASRHAGKGVRARVKALNREAKNGGVRIVVCQLPGKSPRLNPIEPKWGHGKRAVAEPGRKLAAQEMEQRNCLYYGRDLLSHLEQKVAGTCNRA